MSDHFYQQHLNRVSRSFSFCIARLDNPLRERVGLMYLLCRVLDTIEDAPWTSMEAQAKQFQEFDRFLAEKPNQQKLAGWKHNFPELPQSEGRLIDDSWRLFHDLHEQPSAVQQAMRPMITSMSYGMQYFCRQGHRLQNLKAVNAYCLFVAGVVGEALTLLFGHDEHRLTVDSHTVRQAHHFGLFLQKVNLLKDELKDKQEGRYLVPDRAFVEQSLGVHADEAFCFIENLPRDCRGFRLFCAWSLFLGLGTLPWVRQAHERGQSGKIPKTKARSVLKRAENNIDDNYELRKAFNALKTKAGIQTFEDRPSVGSTEGRSEWESFYQGRLYRRDLEALGAL